MNFHLKVVILSIFYPKHFQDDIKIPGFMSWIAQWLTGQPYKEDTTADTVAGCLVSSLLTVMKTTRAIKKKVLMFATITILKLLKVKKMNNVFHWSPGGHFWFCNQITLALFSFSVKVTSQSKTCWTSPRALGSRPHHQCRMTVYGSSPPLQKTPETSHRQTAAPP